MNEKSIIIIGAGMGGLAAGIYGQINGYRTQIFEMHALPGGQCASWKRHGYTFDGCIHHLFGCGPDSRLYSFWQELGAMPRELVQPKDCVSAMAPDGRMYWDYYELDALERHLKEFSPRDAGLADQYVGGIRSFVGHDIMGDLMFGGTTQRLAVLPQLVRSFRWLKPTMRQFGERFADPILRTAFPLLEYSLPEGPFLLHLLKHASGAMGDIAWPLGGALPFAQSIARRYLSLGGEVHYRSRVVKVLVENDRAVGVRLADGSEHRADVVVSNADGRKTIAELLESAYTDARIRAYCADPPDETNWAVHVFLGVNRDLSSEPSSLVMLLPSPVTICGHECQSIEMQMYGHDPTMAPPGKGVIKVELFSRYSYWKQLAADGHLYEEEKQRVAETVIDLLESRFPGLRQQVEAVDVPTLMTWERYMGGTHGFANLPNKKMSPLSLFGVGLETRLPGLQSFYFAGAWATTAGALFANALSGRKVIQTICKAEGSRFVTKA